MEEFIKLRFTGSGVAPSNTRCKDVAALIKSVEDLVGALTEAQDEDDELPEENPVYVLAIEDASLGFKFLAGHMAIALMAWQSFTTTINANRLDLLDRKVRDPLETIVSFVKKRNCNLEFRDSRDTVMARITPAIELPKTYKLSTKTSIIGQVVRVGGNDPKVGLRMANGKVLSCETSEEIAKDLGHRLYDLVACKGVATWDVASNSVLKFRINSVGAFRKSPASSVFAALASAMPLTVERWKSEGMRSTAEEE